MYWKQFRLALCVTGGGVLAIACDDVTVEITSPTPGGTLSTRDASIVFSVSGPGASGALSTTCQLDSAPSTPCTSPHPYTGLADGPHTVKVTGTSAGGSSQSATVRFAVVTGAGAQVKQVTAGRNHTCALLLDGRVRCWGNADKGQLGDGTTTPVPSNEFPTSRGDVQVGAPVVQIAAGAFHTCALLTTGGVRCWGDGSLGALGYGNTQTLPSPGGDADVGGAVVQIAAGDVHTCALLATGSVRCWGWGGYGQLGYGNGVAVGDNELPSSAGDVNVGGPVVRIAAGSTHTCALLSTGNVRCWGAGHGPVNSQTGVLPAGQLGYGNTNHIGDDELPASAGDVNVGGPVVQIAAGGHHTCALLSTGSARCWGEGHHGALGYGNTNNVGDDELPAAAGDVNAGGSLVQIAAGQYHTCAILSTGRARCWGLGNFGQLGYGNVTWIGDNELPSSAGDVNVGGSLVQIAAGGLHTCAVLSTGSVRCWGYNGFRQLGYYDAQNVALPSSAGDVPLAP